jgi:hypothetical protein
MAFVERRKASFYRHLRLLEGKTRQITLLFRAESAPFFLVTGFKDFCRAKGNTSSISTRFIASFLVKKSALEKQGLLNAIQ